MTSIDYLVTELSQLSGVAANELTEILADETKGKAFFENFKQSNVIYKKDEFEKLLINKEQEYLDKHAEAKEINPKIYKRVSGTVKEMTEKNIAKRFGITEYSGLDDLLEKAEAKLKVTANSDEKDAKILELKNLVKTVEKEKSEALSAKEKEVDAYIIGSVMSSAVSELPIDFEGDQLKIQREIVATMFEKKYILERKDNKIIAINRDTKEVVKDRVGDPVEVTKLLAEFAPTVTKVKEVPAGGRGDESSQKNKTMDVAKITTGKDFYDYLKEKKINPNSKEAQEVLKVVKKANPKFNLTE